MLLPLSQRQPADCRWFSPLCPGEEGGTWYIDLKTNDRSAGFGKPPVTADVVMSMSSGDFVKMFTGESQRHAVGGRWCLVPRRFYSDRFILLVAQSAGSSLCSPGSG